MFTSYRTRPLIVACIMHCSQQLSGVNAVIFYSTSIFRTAGLAHNDAQYATLSLGGIMILMTFVCMVLVDKLGRRTLHLSGLAGCIVSLSSLTVFLTVEKVIKCLKIPRESRSNLELLCIASVGVFIISFNVGPGSIPWFYTSELFEPNSARWAVSISIAVNWLCNFAVGVSFLHLQIIYRHLNSTESFELATLHTLYNSDVIVKASPLLGDRTLPDSESEKKDRRVTQPVTSGEQVSRGRRQEVDMPVITWLSTGCVTLLSGSASFTCR
ncbi:Glut1 [Bugula neritina]|uniref:Glut1 n=1 Tax=Bugula neritina TaxID=10212 RepID=A0A7J7JJU0_BUGNE|nr:Glut1 [Bugula neritina]